jgi:hypothetical protein
MGLTNDLGQDAKDFLHDQYRDQIDPVLDEIATTLYELGASGSQAVKVATLTASLSAIIFKAGMEFQERLS